ncbi:MAG: hypothetical protein WBW62_09490, partial [Solirubrobacterales bacterium]
MNLEWSQSRGYALAGIVAIVAFLTASFAAGPAMAGGLLDTSFGHKGKVTSNVALNELTRSGNISEVKVFDDGRFGVVIDLESRLDRPTVMRFLPDGSPDLSFNGDGMMKLAPYSSVASLDDGRMLVSGRVGNGDPGQDVAVRRYLEDGSLDSSFGKRGLFRLDLGLSDSGRNIVPTADGRIAVQAGSSCSATKCGYSLYAQWQLLVSDSGKLIRKSRLSGEYAPYEDLTAAPDGTLLALEGHGEYGDEGSSLISLDRKLNKTTIRDLGNPAEWFGIYSPFANNGFYSFAGGQTSGLEKVLRILPDGTIDPTFGQGGSATCTGDPLDHASGSRSIEVDSEGRLLVSLPRLECQLMRLLPDGSFDSSFAGDGKLSLPSDGSYLRPWKATPALDGKVLLALWDSSRGHLVLSRLKENGETDTEFGDGGEVDLPIMQPSLDRATAIVATGHGRTVTAGLSQCDGSPPEVFECRNYVLTERDARGRPVSGFGDGGQVSLESIKVKSIVRSTDGKLVVSGTGTDPSEPGGAEAPGFAIARFNKDGTPDLSFGGDGRVDTFFPDRTRYATALDVATQPDGRILATGRVVSERKGRSYL